MKKKYKILIVGGTGFIGYHLAKNLKKKYNVTSLSTKKPKKIRFLKNIKYLTCDISNKSMLKKKLCDEYNLDFMEVMTKYNNTYNEGYTKLGKPNVVRPVLYPTDKIGGHCVIPNAKLLPRTKLIDGLLDYE